MGKDRRFLALCPRCDTTVEVRSKHIYFKQLYVASQQGSELLIKLFLNRCAIGHMRVISTRKDRSNPKQNNGLKFSLMMKAYLDYKLHKMEITN